MKSRHIPNIFILFLVLFEFNVYMANDLIMPGMLNVVQEFQSQEALIPLSLSLYLLGGLCLQFIIGPVSDRVGRRPTMIAGAFFFSLCTLAIASSLNMFWFLTAKFLQGMGLCFIGVCGYASVQELFEEKKAVRVVAWMTSVAVTAPIIGPILGGFLTQVFSWRWIFIFTWIVALISLWGLWMFMPETAVLHKMEADLDEESSSPKLASRGDSFALRSGVPKSPQSQVLGRVLRWIQRFKRFWKTTFVPLLISYKKLLAHPKLVLGGCLNGLLAAPTLCWIAISPIVLFKNAEIESQYYGLVQVPIFGCFIFGNFILRKLTFRFSLPQIIRMGFPISVVGLLALFFFSRIYSTSYWSLILPLSLFCIGIGIMGAPITRLSLYSTSAKKGIASAVHSFVSTTVLITAISLLPMVFHGKNSDFGSFCLGYGAILCVLVFKFLAIK